MKHARSIRSIRSIQRWLSAKHKISPLVAARIRRLLPDDV
jgi:hypothetical protein